MKQAWLIATLDLRLFLREKSSYIWLLVIPLVFTYFMGFAVRGPTGPNITRPAVLIENADTQFLSRVFLDDLGLQGLEVISPTNRDQAKRGLRLPADFTERVLRKEKVALEFFTVSGSGDETAALVELRVLRALVTLNARLVEHATRHGKAPPSEATLRDLSQSPDPVVLNARFAGRKPIPSGFSLSLPGNLVMYLMMNTLVFGGASLAWARRSGVLRRVMVHPVTRGELVTGKILGLMLLASVQIGVFLVLGQLVFQVNVGDQLPTIVVTLLVYSWVAAALGVWIGSVLTAEEKIIGVCLLLAMVMGALGGCWWPLEIVPESVRLAAHVVPTGWAMDALHQLISFGAGFDAARGAIGVLVLYGLAATFAAVKCFRV